MKPIASAIIIGRIPTSELALPADDFSISIQGHNEVETEDGTVKVARPEDSFKISEVSYDPRVQEAFALLYAVIVDRLEGKLPSQVQDEASPSDPEPGV